MKKIQSDVKSSMRLLSILLTLSLVFLSFGGVPAQAEEAAPAEPSADISGNITIPQGESITFTITVDAYFVIGSSGVLDSREVDLIGNKKSYVIYTEGEPGSSTGLYLVAPGKEPQKFCVVTVGPPNEVLPDTPEPPETPTAKISYSENYQCLKFRDMRKNEIMYSEIAVDNPELLLSIVSKDESIMKVLSFEQLPIPGHYVVALQAVGEGYTTLTTTASDGTSEDMSVIVKGVLDKDYTLTSDTTKDFSIQQNGSYFIKINFTYTGPTTDSPTWNPSTFGGSIMLEYPLLVSGNPDILVTLVSKDDSEYLFRIDAAGNAGQTATLYAGSYNYMPEELCKVTISAAPKNIRLDTTGLYACNSGDSYRFVAYTNNSTTRPTVNANNDLVSVQYVCKVNGGYEYRMTAQNGTGFSLVRVTSGGETVSFPVLVDNSFEPIIESDTNEEIKLAKGESYTYKFTIMGGGEPTFKSVYNAVPTDDGIMRVQLVKKDGLNYYVKVTATSDKVGEQSYVCIMFPNNIHHNPNSFSGYGEVQIKSSSAPTTTMKSDTNSNFTLNKGSSYTFKISNATKFVPGSAGIFETKLIRKSGNDSYYKVTATGKVGSSVGFYMSNGNTTQRVCMVTIGNPASIAMKSDTTSDFSLVQGKSYTFKITGATNFTCGSPGAFKTELVKKVGNDRYYKITATGKAGSSAGLYMSAPGQAAQIVCIVTIIPPGSFTSDTTEDFCVPILKKYTFKITAPGANSVKMTIGTPNTFKVVSSSRSGDNFYFSIATRGGSGSDNTGIYVSVDGQPPKKVCVVHMTPNFGRIDFFEIDAFD